MSGDGPLRILCIGDVVGSPGRKVLRRRLPELRRELRPDFVVVNAENASGGVGLTAAEAKELLGLGVDVLTGGNHLWKYKEMNAYLDQQPRLLRPHNYPPGAPGRGVGVFQTEAGVPVAVINLQGRAFMEPVDCPFRTADALLDELAEQARVVVVDFHAEATSEKRALGWHLDGRVSAIFGTHTHVPTADAEVLPGGTGYITDVGMTGPYRSVIGSRIKPIVQRFLTQRPASFGVAKGDARLCGVLFEVDPESGRALSTRRIEARLEPEDNQ